MQDTLAKNGTPATITQIRDQFPLLKEKMRGKPIVFLDSAASSQKPQVVIDAIERYYQHTHANVHRGVYALSQEATTQFEHSRTIMQQFINAASEKEVIFVRGATEGINLVASSYGRKFFKEGDEILVSTMEHHSNIVPWQMIAEETGAKVRVIPITREGEIIFESYKKMLNERTKMVAIVHVSNTLGTINPIKKMVEAAHQKRIPVLVDGAQATPHMKVDVQDLDADFYVFSGHKMYGPTGIGILYGKEKWLNEMPPYHGGGEMIQTVTFEKTTYNELPFKFEAGTPNIAGSIALGEAAKFVEKIGQDFIAEHEAKLLAYGTEKLAEIPGIQFYGQATNKASVISFLLEGAHPYDIGTILDHLGVAVRTGHHCTEPLMRWYDIPGTVRASFGIYNTKEDIDQLIAGVKKAASMLI